ncbi:hypothetical protein CALVIDRAFT_531881 [Calocera viscosa TUFC12733]|uniref:BRCT domain-containing protein n=1 Tax=Calocera viscosa (strain TUFC12733) TaxID=1330018 RepID=A0A167FQL3_CALVF|nr:hypothetical protein CALVIDRAFT_531881 [Calocera viscosa TUFC12733]
MSEADEFGDLNAFGVNPTLFRDNDKPLKFYIQDPPNIDKDTRAEIAKKLTDHGGQVLKVIPRHGVIIYNANKPKSFGARWSDTELHTVVHMTWVDKCIETNSVEDPDVPMDDEPVPVPSTRLTVPLEKRLLTDMEYGGFCAILRCQARVILVDASEDALEDIARLRTEFWNSDVYVEDKHVLEKWIEKGSVVLTRPQRKGMPGRRAGSARVDFTPADDAILVAHIARQIPDPKTGGRFGFTLYQMLESRLRADAQKYILDHDSSSQVGFPSSYISQSLTLVARL